MTYRRSLGAIAGIGELKPVRWTKGETTLGMIAKVARLAAEDAGNRRGRNRRSACWPASRRDAQHVPATVAEYLGLQPRMANVVDLGGASRAAGLARRRRHRRRNVRHRPVRAGEHA